MKGPVLAQDGKQDPIQLFSTWAEPGRSYCTGKKWTASPSFLSHSSQALMSMITSWSLSHGHPGYGLLEATGHRCLALQHPHCSWQPAAPAGQELWPVSVLASRRSGRQNVACNMSGRPEPSNGYKRQWKENVTDESPTNTQRCIRAQRAITSHSPNRSLQSCLLLHSSNSLNIRILGY